VRVTLSTDVRRRRGRERCCEWHLMNVKQIATYSDLTFHG
jgi:hypothetical protein